MKKILLSCVTCLLALGLVTACNNEDEVENNDGTTQDTGSGGGSDTGSGGGTSSGGGSSEPVTLTNYIVSFSFVDEDGAATTLGDGYSLYLAGSWDGWADDSWIECPYDEETGYYVATFESIETGTYKYKGVSCETGSPSWSGEEVVTDNGGDATLTVTETNSGQIIETVYVYVPPVYISEFTLKFILTGEEIPDYATLYISADFNNWGFGALTIGEGEGVYTYTIDSISVGEHHFKLVMWYSDEEVNWIDHYVEVVNTPWVDSEGNTQYGDVSFEVTASQSDGDTLELTYEVSATLEEKVITVTSISLSPTSLSFAYEDIAATNTQTITASVIGSDGKVMEDEEVTWASDTETVTTVADGVVTPIGPGSATITAASVTDPEVSATCSVYVAESGVVLVESLTLDQTTLAFDLDSEEQTTATLTATLAGESGAVPSNLGVTWTSSDQGVATVEEDENGTDDTAGTVTATVTALGPGETTITATSQEGGKTATCEVSVSATLEYTVTLTLTSANGSDFVIGDEYDVYLVGAFDMTGNDWNLNSDYILTQVGGTESNVYSVEVGTIAEQGTYNCQLLAEPQGEAEAWGHAITGNFELTFGSSSNVTAEVTLTIDSFEDIFLELGTDTNFYIIFLDTDSTSADTFSSVYVNSGKALFTDGNTYTSVTTGTSGSTNKTYICTSASATLAANDQDWFYIYESSLLDVSTGTITIPETSVGTYAVYVCSVDLSNTSHNDQNGYNGVWTAGVTSITDFIASL